MRRQQRDVIANLYDKERMVIEEEIRRVEAKDFIEMEVRKRQDWMQQYKDKHRGKPPPNMKKYEDSLNKEKKEKKVTIITKRDTSPKKSKKPKKKLKKVNKSKSEKDEDDQN
jgi:hypothetical protein